MTNFTISVALWDIFDTRATGSFIQLYLIPTIQVFLVRTVYICLVALFFLFILSSYELLTNFACGVLGRPKLRSLMTFIAGKMLRWSAQLVSSQAVTHPFWTRQNMPWVLNKLTSNKNPSFGRRLKNNDRYRNTIHKILWDKKALSQLITAPYKEKRDFSDWEPK